MRDGVEEAVPEKTSPWSPEAPEAVFVDAAAARRNPLPRVAQANLQGQEKRERGKGVDGELLEALAEAADATLKDVEAAEADEVVEEARLKDVNRQPHLLDPKLWEDEDACLEEVERVVRLLQHRQLP